MSCSYITGPEGFFPETKNDFELFEKYINKTIIPSDDEIKKRKSQWKPKVSNFESGTLWKYAQSVGDATNGAVTHPGAFKEKKVYADI